MSRDIFSPVGATTNLTASATTSNVILDNMTGQPRSVRVYNPTAAIVFIEFGASSAVEAAVATSLPLGPGAVEWFEIGPAVTHMAAITSAGGGTVYASEGQGA